MSHASTTRGGAPIQPGGAAAVSVACSIQLTASAALPLRDAILETTAYRVYWPDAHPLVPLVMPLGRAQQQRTQALAQLSALEPTPPPPGPCLDVITSIDLSTLRGKLQALKASSAAPATPSDPVHQPASP
ncbi:hypothetical protein HaLaN_31419, partial [Haematococcus lacustris]